MAATAITVQNVTANGLAMTYESANVDGNYFTNTNGCFLFVRNTSAVTVTVTFAAPNDCNYGNNHVFTRDVAVNEQCVIPLTPKRFNNSSDITSFTYSAVTDVEVAVGRVV